jgi:gluconokinase
MPAIVVMGVSGCGKSTLGKALAAALQYTFIEGDTLHPPANIERMRAGIALTDVDREPFLHNVGQALQQHAAAGVVVSCSALKRSYRDLLRRYCPDLLFVLPLLAKDELQARLQARPGHFMPASLIDSQLATLELPDTDESILQLQGLLPVEAQAEQVLAWLGVGAGRQ